MIDRSWCSACATASAAWALACVLSSGSVARAQAPAPDSAPASPVTRSRAEPPSRTVQLDAVVFDRTGAPILNLTPRDFEVVESGVVQRLDAVELRAVPASTAAAAPVGSDEDEVRAAREPGTRVIALLLDEFHVGAGEPTERVRSTMRRFVDEMVRPGDLLVVLKPLEPIVALRFTRDRARAREAIDSFQGRKDDFAALTAFERQYLGTAPEAVRAGRAQIVLAALRALIMKMGDLNVNRAAVVLVSEGFHRDGPRDRERRVPDMQGLVRAASRFNVAVYTLDPAGASAPVSASDRQADREAAMLRSIAAETGGEAVADARDLLPALHRLSRDLDAYYVLTYTSSHPADGRFYDVQVRARRRDAVVRTRTGYWAPLRTALMRADAVTTPRAPARALRRSPFIETWLGFTVDTAGTGYVVFTWEPAASTTPRKVLGEPHSIELRVTSASGAPLFEGTLRHARSTIGPQELTSAVFEAPPGRIQLDLAVLRPDGSQLDTAANDVDVPDPTKADPVLLSPQVFRSSSAREFRDLAADARAAPVPARAFRRTERLLVRAPAYSASGARITVAARLLNRSGQLVRELAPIASADGVRQFDLPLAFLAPGEYRIELSAATPAATAREVLPFRITG